MNISTSITVEGTAHLVTVTSDIELHEDTVWAVASQALAVEERISFSHLSRYLEAYEIRQGESKTYVARFVEL